MEFAREIVSINDYVHGIDRMLVYLGRYGYQSVIETSERATMRDLRSWVGQIDEFLKEEQRQARETK
jgi:hypothetical protein